MLAYFRFSLLHITIPSGVVFPILAMHEILLAIICPSSWGQVPQNIFQSSENHDLVRHQAPLGETQSRLLGILWITREE